MALAKAWDSAKVSLARVETKSAFRSDELDLSKIIQTLTDKLTGQVQNTLMKDAPLELKEQTKKLCPEKK